MNKILIIGALSLALTMAGSNASARKPKQTPATKEFHFKTGDDERRDAFVSDLMSKMSLEEKLGQLNLASSWMFRSTASDSQKEETMEGVRKGMYGALYGFNDVAQLRQIQEEAIKGSPNKIPYFFGMDVIHGLETAFPIPLAMASSWDTTMVRQAMKIAGTEARATGITWVFSPMVDICRDPRWGRIAEGNGEDPFLGGEMAKAYVRGYHEAGVIPCVKHYALYGAALGGRDYNSVFLSRQEAFNGYMRPYQQAALEGAESFMSSFNEFEGIPATANHYLLTDVLRGMYGFKGFVVSDATAVMEVSRHGLGDLQEVSALALKAGLDMDMNSNGFIGTLKKSLYEGKVSMDDIDLAVRRILNVKWKLGLFDDAYNALDVNAPAEQVYTPENRSFARTLADECIVLLKNDGVLPLKKSVKVAIVGPLADNPSEMLGSWSMSSHGADCISFAQGLRSVLGSSNVSVAEGCWVTADSTEEEILRGGMTAGLFGVGPSAPKAHQRPLDEMIDEALRASVGADVVIAALGELNAMNGEGSSRSDISLPEPQKKLLKALGKLGKPIVLLLSTGRPLVLTEEDADPSVNAIVCSWNLGSEAGNAVADVLFGDVNPSAKITASFPRSVGQLPTVYYNHKSTGRPWPDYKSYKRFSSNYQDVINAPLYPFGYGLSYTTFTYGDVSLSEASMPEDGTVTASVRVTNSGSRPGVEVVQLYIHDIYSTSTRPVKELKGFQRLSLEPGESKVVSFKINADLLSYYNHELEWVAEPGDFDIMIGGNSRDVKSARLTLR